MSKRCGSTLAWRRWVLAGQSFGAWVAASYAAKHPYRVERLMLWSPAPPTGAFAAAREAATNRFLGEADTKRAAELWIRMATGPDSDVVPSCQEWVRTTFRFYVSDPTALSRMRGDYCAGTAAAIRHQNRAMDIVDASFKDFDFRPELRTLRIPTLVMEGAETRVPLAATEEWARVIPDADCCCFRDRATRPGSKEETHSLKLWSSSWPARGHQRLGKYLGSGHVTAAAPPAAAPDGRDDHAR